MTWNFQFSGAFKANSKNRDRIWHSTHQVLPNTYTKYIRAKKKENEKRGTIPRGIASEFDSKSRTDVLNSFLCLLSILPTKCFFSIASIFSWFSVREKYTSKWANRKLVCVINWMKEEKIEENTSTYWSPLSHKISSIMKTSSSNFPR